MPRNRSQRKLRHAGVIAGSLAAAVVLGVVLYAGFRLSHSDQNRLAGSAPPATLKLPFTIPCAVNSGDAVPVYAAFRRHDRDAIEGMLADKRFVAVNKGIAVHIATFGVVSMIVIDARPPHRPGVCFVPAEIIPVIRRHTFR